MKTFLFACFTTVSLSGCSDSSHVSSDPFLADLPALAEKHEMPDGFVGTFTEAYLKEVTPEVERIRREVSPIQQELDVWNHRMLVYTSLWSDHGVDFHFTPILYDEELALIRSQLEELRASVEALEIENAELRQRLSKTKGEQGESLKP